MNDKSERNNFQNDCDHNEFDDDFYNEIVEEKRNSRSRRHRPPRMNVRHERAFNKYGDDY